MLSPFHRYFRADEMEVIGHQDPGGEAPAEAVDNLAEEGEA